MWEIPRLKHVWDRLVESLEEVINIRGLSNLSNFRRMKSDEITTRAFFSLVDVTDNQRLIDVFDEVPFLGYPLRIASVSQSHANLRIPFHETRYPYTETDRIIAPPDRDMGFLIGNHRNENNNETTLKIRMTTTTSSP